MATQESNPWENLPHDILTQIFLRLPIKSLLILRCVSKSWLSVISSPEFKNTHLKTSTSRKRLIYGSRTALHTLSISPKFDADPSVDNVPFDFDSHDRNRSIQIVGSCNGLVCLVSRGGSVIVCNPALRKYRQIRIPSIHYSSRACGFGYDACNDDYKVVTLTNAEKIEARSLRLYSFRDDSWKTSDPIQGTMSGWPCVSVNGAIHWKFYYGGDDSRDWGVVAQSLTTGHCSSLALPASATEFPYLMAMLGVWGESLSVYFGSGVSMDVWVMKEYGVAESWSKVVRVPCFIGRDDLEIAIKYIVIDSEDGNVLLYVPHTYIGTYTESFVSPDLEVACTRLEIREEK